jgi:hypothetical protein
MEPKDTKTTIHPLFTTDPNHPLLPGIVFDGSPEEAEDWGAFQEEALSDEDAWDSAFDVEVDHD